MFSRFTKCLNNDDMLKFLGISKTVFGTVKEYTLEKRKVQKYEAAFTRGNGSRFR